MLAADPKLDASHAFYLGYELSKAVTALTLGKNYTQDQALRWGFLTVPETTPLAVVVVAVKVTVAPTTAGEPEDVMVVTVATGLISSAPGWMVAM